VVDGGRRDDQAMRATAPTLVIEILSPSTRASILIERSPNTSRTRTSITSC
jgi:Uma2 family endonuclease